MAQCIRHFWNGVARHQSYLVNSRYVYWMDRNTVRTQDGRRFSVSSSYREQAREKYLGYVKQI